MKNLFNRMLSERAWFFRISMRSKLTRLRCVLTGGHKHTIVKKNFFFADPPVMGEDWYFPSGALMRPAQPVGSIDALVCERCHSHVVKVKS